MEKTLPIRNEGEEEAAAAAATKGREESQWITEAEEYEMISKPTSFDKLRAMVEGEASVNRRKKRRKGKRKKNNNESQFHAQHPVPVNAGRPAIDTEQAGKDEDVRTMEVSKWDFIEISDNNVPMKFAVDTAVKENKMIETAPAINCRTEGNGDKAGSKEVTDLCSSSSKDDDGLISNVSSGKSIGEMVSAEATIIEDGEMVGRNELKTVVAEETVDTGMKEMHAEEAKHVETVKSPENSAENTVLRNLLRKPRYFDPPNGSWARCLSYGEDYPAAVNYTLRKLVKACFLCGSRQHIGKHCSQAQHCFVRRKPCDQANDCPKKQEENNLSYISCLRCGDSGHDMFSCRSDYSADDLKKIRCYTCNDFGHLSCVKLPNTSPTEVSCYNCGQSGHLGSECSKCPKVAGGSKSPALCYRCREEGHFARSCTLPRKRANRVQAEMRRSLGSSSAPPDHGPRNDAKDEMQESLIIDINQ